jgi:hypothetical protein
MDGTTMIPMTGDGTRPEAPPPRVRMALLPETEAHALRPADRERARALLQRPAASDTLGCHK